MANNNIKTVLPVTRQRSKRTSWQVGAVSGGRRRFFVLAALGAAATIYLLGFDSLRHDADLASKAPAKKCRPGIHWRAADASGCSYAFSESTGSGLSAVGYKALPSEIRKGGLTSNHDSTARVHHDNRADDLRLGQALNPGVTVAELCSQATSRGRLHCRNTEVGRTRSTTTGGYTGEHAPPGSISGHVLTSDGEALAGVPLLATPRQPDGRDASRGETVRFWTKTDSFGAYAFHGIPDGEYTIRSARHHSFPAARIAARAGIDYADIVVSEHRETVAEGRVLSGDGWPLAGVTVLPALSGQASVLTDGDGRFQLPVGLKSSVSSFELRFQMPGFREQTADVILANHDSGDGILLDVVMMPIEALTSVSGSVTSRSGNALAHRTVELRALSSRQTQRTTTNSDGQFEFPIVEAEAEYQLIVLGGTDHKDFAQRVYVSTDMQELAVTADAYEFGSVAGKLVNQHGESVPDFELVFRNTGSRKPNAVVRTDAQGEFEIAAAPAGQFVLASQSSPSILVQGLVLDPGQELNLPLVLDWGGHEIRGIVIDADDNPVPASKVVLHWSHDGDGINARTTRRTASDTQGYFAFSNLGPGPHSLLIDAPGYPSVDLDHDLESQGYSLTVRLN